MGVLSKIIRLTIYVRGEGRRIRRNASAARANHAREVSKKAVTKGCSHSNRPM